MSVPTTPSVVERVARAIDAASDEVSMAFREPHPLSDQRVAEYCAADRAKRIRQARAAVEALTVDDLEALLREHLSGIR